MTQKRAEHGCRYTPPPSPTTVSWYPFMLWVGGEREALGEWSVECHAQEHAIMTQPGLDARPLDKSKIENRRLKKVELF